MRSAALVAGALAVQALGLPRLAIAQDDFMWDLDPGPDTHNRVDLESLSRGGKPYTDAAKLDPLGDALGREVVPGATLTWSGLQIHSACGRHAEKLGSTRDEIDSRIGLLIRISLQKLLACRRTYPEVNGYVREAISALRRMALTCSDNLPRSARAGHIGSAHDLRHLEAWEKGGLGNYLIWDSPAKLHEPIVAVSKGMVKELLESGGPDSLAVHSFVHELLHAAGADNRDDHNDLQRVSTTPVDACGLRNFDDRVVLVASLCTGMDQFEIKQVEERVRERIRRCGCGWCERTFTSSVSWTKAFYLNSDPLSEKQADRICGRIFDRGAPGGPQVSDAPSCKRSRANLLAAEAAIRAAEAVTRKAESSCAVDVISGL